MVLRVARRGGKIYVVGCASTTLGCCEGDEGRDGAEGEGWEVHWR